MLEEIAFTLQSHFRAAHTYFELRESVEWNNFSAEQAVKAINGSAHFILAKDGEKAVAMGRAVGDGMYYVILDVAIEILKKNALEHNVSDRINGITTPIEEFAIPTAEYDLILTVSVLEHIDTKQHFIDKLHEIAHGIKKNGIVCLVINSDITEVDAETGASLEPNFEVNLKSDQIMTYLDGIFEGWTVVKKTVVAQEYEIPRDNRTSQLSSKVISFVAQKVRK